MQRHERLALIALGLILIGLPLVTLGYQYVLRPALAPTRVIDIRAAAPENGGFQPASVQVATGETVTLRFYANDVTHGVAIGPGLGIDLGQIEPGHVAEVTVTFSEAGTYTYYCNTWCSDGHWRMRGVIEVRDPDNPAVLPTVPPDPIIEALLTEGVDVDAVPGDEVAPVPGLGPDVRLSAERGESLLSELTIPPELQEAAWRFTHTPSEGLTLLAEANPDRAIADVADAVAALWVADTSAGTLADAISLYEKNCAACHGQTGNGDGPAADTTAEAPIAFADAAHMFGRRGDVLYAKTRRGGMGTGMPNFGTVFTREETLALVDYLWTLAFGAAGSP